VAITLLLTAIGTLGLAGAQLAALRLENHAQQRGRATALASGIMEDMRANRGALERYESVVGRGAVGEPAPPPVDCGLGSCTPEQVSAWDLWRWGQALEGASKSGVYAQPGGAVGCISIDARRVTVEIAWQDRWAPFDPNGAVECGAGADAGEEGRHVLRLTSYVGRH
jgi:type IV pilus assembly protein PilV